MWHLIKSFKYAFKGFRVIWREERNFRTGVAISVVALLSMAFLGFSVTEFVLAVVVIIIVLAAEIINTALEDICDKVKKEYDVEIGKIKDIGAALVATAVFGALIVGVLIVVFHFFV